MNSAATAQLAVETAEGALGLVFQDKTLLQRALTHRSYLNENQSAPLADNERLEFLGDAVLDFVVGEDLFQRFPDEDEGTLGVTRGPIPRRERGGSRVLVDRPLVCVEHLS